jgi:MOSC domain-containing protein YiiM
MDGIVVSLHLKEKHGEPVIQTRSVEAEAGKGLVGDLSYGASSRQVLLIEEETLTDFGLVPGQVKENITVKGLALAGKPKGTRIRAGETLMEVVADCTPCRLMEEIKPGLQSAIRGRRGTLCRVLEGGTVKVGDRIWLVEELT